jgi:hypothetical protein
LDYFTSFVESLRINLCLRLEVTSQNSQLCIFEFTVLDFICELLIFELEIMVFNEDFFQFYIECICHHLNVFNIVLCIHRNLRLTYMLLLTWNPPCLVWTWLRKVFHRMPTNQHLVCLLWFTKGSGMLFPLFFDNSPLMCRSCRSSILIAYSITLLSAGRRTQFDSASLIHLMLQLWKFFLKLNDIFMLYWDCLYWDALVQLVILPRILSPQILDRGVKLDHFVLLSLQSWS